MGTFSIDMKSAQVTDTGSSGSGGASSVSGSPSATADVTGPIITGGVITPTDDGTGLTYRDKVQLRSTVTDYRLSLHMVL